MKKKIVGYTVGDRGRMGNTYGWMRAVGAPHLPGSEGFAWEPLRKRILVWKSQAKAQAWIDARKATKYGASGTGFYRIRPVVRT